MENKFIVARAGRVAKMKIFGEIDNSGYTLGRFLQEFESLEQDDSIDEIEILINSLGGSVFKGMPIISAIANSSKLITTIGDTVVASMGALIFLAGQKRKLYDYTQVMLHSAKYDDGHEDEALKNVNDNIFNLIKTVTKRAKDKIKGWLAKDTWFTAGQAIENNLATEIIKTRLSRVQDYQSQVRNMVASARSIDDINHLKTKYEKMDKLFSILNLSPEAGDEAIEKKVKEIQNTLAIKEQELTNRDTKITELEAKVSQFEAAEKAKRESEINALLDEASKNRQISAENKATWKTLLSADFDSACKALKALAKTEKISDIIDTGEEKKEPQFVPSPIQSMMRNPL